MEKVSMCVYIYCRGSLSSFSPSLLPPFPPSPPYLQHLDSPPPAYLSLIKSLVKDRHEALRPLHRVSSPNTQVEQPQCFCQGMLLLLLLVTTTIPSFPLLLLLLWRELLVVVEGGGRQRSSRGKRGGRRTRRSPTSITNGSSSSGSSSGSSDELFEVLGYGFALYSEREATAAGEMAVAQPLWW